MKHVEIDLHFVQERVAIGDVCVLHVPTTSQFVDIFTKGLSTSVFSEFRPVSTFAVARVSTAGGVRVYLVGYIFCTIDYHIYRDIFGMIDIMYCRLSYVSRGVFPLKTPASLYICTFIKQYNHLIFDGTPLSN
jgi:hypothetical protein